MTHDYRYQKKWRLDRAMGRARMQDATEIRAHINTLLAAHLPQRAVADLAQVNPTVICSIVNGQATVSVAIARRILAIDVEQVYARPKRTGFVPNLGARRRIQALMALGWRHADITAAAGGIESQRVLHQVGGWVALDTHDAVVRAYTELSNQPGPSQLTRRRAAAAGYAPPAAWDEEDLDDPYAQTPDGYGIRHDQCTEPGCVAPPEEDHDRCPMHRPGQARQQRGSVDLEEWLHLVRGGEDPERAARRCGVTLGGVEAAANRHNRSDVQAWLRRTSKEDAA